MERRLDPVVRVPGRFCPIFRTVNIPTPSSRNLDTVVRVVEPKPLVLFSFARGKKY